LNNVPSRFQRHSDKLLFQRIDIASLAAFRILFGLLMAGAMIRVLLKGWVRELYVETPFHFPYPGFEWVHAWPGFWMHFHFVALAALALAVASGLFYRASIVLFFIGFTYVELIDQTTYLNHYYLISLLAGLMMFLPAHRAWSLDVRRNPSLRADSVPSWTVNLLRFQVGVVYIFAGLAKLNPDWLFHAQPLRIWLAALSDTPLIGGILEQIWAAFAGSWIGAIYDLTIVFFLLCSRTRPIAYLAVMGFHVMTWVFFRIGMFPWVMIVNTLIFFPPSWPRGLADRLGSWMPGKIGLSKALQRIGPSPSLSTGEPAVPFPDRRFIVAALAAYAMIQIAIPLRGALYPGPSAWSGAGFNFSWKVMLIEETGYVEFYAWNPNTGERRRIKTRDYITPRQEVLMGQDPNLIRLLARHMGEELRRSGESTIEIHVEAFAAMNGHPSQRLIRSDIDLSRVPPTDWIVPWGQIEEDY
jgi:vitamin K-dependent gamma-carboxylase